MSIQSQSNQETLIADLQNVLDDTENLLKDVSAEAGDQVQALRERIAVNLQSVKAKLIETEKQFAEKTKAAAKATDEYVHENPWQSVGIAAGIGFLLGLLVSRR